MKKLFFAATFVLSVFMVSKSNAQLSISLNIGTQPTWGPTGYDHVDYYYLPDIDAYYYVPGKVFYYQNGSSWVSSPSLPPRYANYDLYGGYKVVVNGVNKPWMNDNVYRTKYASFKGRRGQPIIHDSRDAKYRGNHPGSEIRDIRTVHTTTVVTRKVDEHGHGDHGHDDHDHHH
jgi:hypothetical protein